MLRNGYDEPANYENIVGGNTLRCAVVYDNRKQSDYYLTDTEEEAITKGKEIITDLKKQYKCYPCYLYPDDTKWEIRIYE